VQGNKEKAPLLIFTPDYVKELRDLNVYAIYPDYWGQNIKYKGVHKWGEAPCLGYVREQSPYWAQIAAYTAGLLPLNATFGPKAILIRTKYKKPYNPAKRRAVKNGNNTPSNKV